MNIEEMLTEFTVSKRAEGVKATTITWYAFHLRAFDAWRATGNHRLTPTTMRRYLVYLRDRHTTEPNTPPLAEASIQSAHRALKSFFKWCQESEEVPSVTVSPMEKVRVKRPDPVEPRRATRREVDILLATIPVNGWLGLRDYLIVHTLFYCGLRVGELVLLEEHHFDVESRIVHVPGGKTGAGLVPLAHPVAEAFLAYITHRPTGYTDKLFVSANGGGKPKGALSAVGVRQMLVRRCAEAKIRRLNPHSFRHGIAMHLLNDKRVDATLVQRVLRHANLKTTTTFYAQWITAALVDEYCNVMAE